MKAMIFAAGLGTRLKNLTEEKPKALVEFMGKPMLEHVILKLIDAGINDFVINVHHFADKIESFLKTNKNFNVNIEISDERDSLLDTGGAVLHAKKLLENTEYFLIHNTDIISDINIHNLIECHKKSESIATLAVQKRNSSRKLVFNEENFLCMWRDIHKQEIKIARNTTKKLTDWSFCGIHVINSSIFKYINEKGKFSIIDLYLRLAKDHKISSFISDHSYWFDLGKTENIEEAEKLLK